MLVFGPTRYAEELHCGRVAVDVISAVHGQMKQGSHCLAGTMGTIDARP